MQTADILTKLKITQEELIEEKSLLLSSLLTICGMIKNNYPNNSFSDDACNYYSSKIKSIIEEATFEQEVNLKITSFIEKDDVSRLDNNELLNYIEELLSAFEECYCYRTEYYVELESYFIKLLQFNALTSNFVNNAPEELEPTIPFEEKQKVLSFLSTLK